MLRSTLKNIGLTENEIKVYLCTLSLGQTAASTMAKKCGLKRTTVYSVIDSLTKKAYITCFLRKSMKFYSALDPYALIERSAQRVADAQRTLHEMQKCLPLLNSLKEKHQNVAKLQYFEGVNGVTQAYEDSLSSSEEILAFASVDDLHDYIPEYIKEYYVRRAERGILIRAIFPFSEEAYKLSQKDKDHLRITKFIPRKAYEFCPEINIYDDKILMVSPRQKLAIIVKNEDLADAMKKIHALSWKQAEIETEKILKKIESDKKL